MSLRTDDRQWLIYETDGEVAALTRGLEVMALVMAGKTLARHRIDGIRGIGNHMLRIAEGRMRIMKQNGGAQEVVMDHLEKVLMVALGKMPWTPDAAAALDELYALTVYTDTRASEAGIVGPGDLRKAMRGD